MTSTKLDPMSMLNTAMQRNKGYKKIKSSPIRNSFVSSPSRPNLIQAFNSTMIPKEDQLRSPTTKIRTNRFDFSPMRKTLFKLDDFDRIE